MIRIITDSAADFEPHELEKLNIMCIPLSVTFSEKTFQENVDLSKTGFYELLAMGEYPKTSQASPQFLMDLFEDAHACGDEAIYFSISSAISGTYQTAVMTQNLLGYDTCHVIDTKNATGGQRLLVQIAASLRDSGASSHQIIAQIEALREKVVLFACMDTLEYLYHGGRISHTVYKIGTMANIKPIIRVESDGSIGVPAKAIGMRKGMDQLVKKAEQLPFCKDYPFYVMYTSDISAANSLAERFRSFGIEVPEDQIIQVGAAIGSHVGPNACGMVYIAE